MTPSHLIFIAVMLIAVWSTFEGAERDLFALLDDPPPARAPLTTLWVSARVVSALFLTIVIVLWILRGGA